MKAYKGFILKDDKLVCRDFVFIEGETYSIDGQLKICENGFHACKLLEDVKSYYNYDNKEIVVHEVELLGEILENGDKVVTDKIKIGKRVDTNKYNLHKLLDTYQLIKNTYNNAIIGGSLSLYMRGLITDKPNDLDIIIPYYEYFESNDFTHNQHNSTFYEGISDQLYVKSTRVKVDIFVEPNCKYDNITYCGQKYKILKPNLVIDAKNKLIKNQVSISKHVNHLKQVYTNYFTAIPIWNTSDKLVSVLQDIDLQF